MSGLPLPLPSCLHLAQKLGYHCIHGPWRRVKELVKQSPFLLDAEWLPYSNPMHWAAHRNNVELLDFFYSAVLKRDHPTKKAETKALLSLIEGKYSGDRRLPIHDACLGNYEAIVFLIEHSPNGSLQLRNTIKTAMYKIETLELVLRNWPVHLLEQDTDHWILACIKPYGYMTLNDIINQRFPARSRGTMSMTKCVSP
jgi:hypothetical protein